MKKRLFQLLMATACCFMLAGCGEDWLEEDEYEYDSEIETQSSGSGTPGMSSITISAEDLQVKQTMLENGAIRDSQVKLKGNGEDKVTVLIYMNGSDLESESGEATTDLTEMVSAGDSDKVKVLVQTMGTKSWEKKFGISSDRSQIYSVEASGLKLVKDDLGQLDCTKSETLSNFIKWGASNYPANRYILIFWDHGGGPVYGFGYDNTEEDSDASLSGAAMKAGIKDAGVYFDFIGMDCCIMSSLEVCCGMYDFCDYMILSEDFESGLGWHYTEWMKKLYENTSIPTMELGKIICDEMVNANENNSSEGDKSIMALIDESMMKVLYKTWTDFAYANEDSLLGTNYSKQVKRKKGGRLHPALRSGLFDWLSNEGYDDPQMADYYVTDIMAVAQNIDSEESKALSAALAQTLVYVSSSSGETGLTGLSVTLPYGDADFYEEAKEVFSDIGLDDQYVNWLEAFTSVPGAIDNYSYDSWYENWDWDDYSNDYDWNDWEYYEDEEYWEEDDQDWDDWDYEDSYNSWFDEFGLSWLFGDDYDEDDYYYDDEYYDDEYFEDDWWY